MKINWKVRLKNPVFWVTVIPAAVACIYTVLGAVGIVPAVAKDDIIQYATMAVTALTALGVLVDPTTAGFGDSARAMAYDSPADSDNYFD